MTRDGASLVTYPERHVQRSRSVRSGSEARRKELRGWAYSNFLPGDNCGT